MTRDEGARIEGAVVTIPVPAQGERNLPAATLRIYRGGMWTLDLETRAKEPNKERKDDEHL